MAFMEPTYALDRYAGVTGGTLVFCFFFPFESDDVTGGIEGSAVGVTSPLLAGRDDSQVLAWYKKFNLCMISLFGTL
jgi:hypothetical protein